MHPIVRVFILAVITLPISVRLGAQCPVTVNAGPDQVVCQPGESAVLQGSVSGNYLGFVWDPAAGLSNPNSLTPAASVTGPATYTLTAFAVDPFAPNLVVNPAFEALNTGFSSAFTYTPSPITPGTYFMTTSPSLVFSNFPPCDDHTFGNGTGYMMLVNGTGSAGANVWCQTIAVNPNTYYTMSAWATSSPISQPQLQFSVNGTLVGSPYTVSGIPCNWESFSAAWFSGSATTATLCITDQNNSGNGLFGDDFALDDVFFGEACSESDEVMVSVQEVDAVLAGVAILPCNALPGGIQLDGSASTSGPDISYAWTTSGGNIVSGGNTLTPTVNAEGTYSLTVTFNNGQTVCTDESSIQVLPDPNVVFAFAQVYDDLNCQNPTVTIDGSASSAGPGITYSWTPLSGIATGENTLQPEVNVSGTYTLTVMNTLSGCTSTAEVTVQGNNTPPMAVAGVPGLISCKDTLQTLSGNGSSTGPQFSYLWEVVTWGHIVSGANTLNNCVVDTAGIYSLTVTNASNGCTAIAFVSVENMVAPVAMAGYQQNIDCLNPTTTLSGAGSTGNNLSYLWNTSNGNLVSGDSTIQAVADQGGDYILIVTNNNSGCSDTDTVSVLENTVPPVALIAMPGSLNCQADSVQLDASGSGQGPTFSYSWTTLNGNFLSGTGSLFPVVNATGDYTLTVSDAANGCTATASVTVTQDTIHPVVDAGPDGMIDCVGTPIILTGSGSGQADSLLFSWATVGGNILSGGNTPSAEVNASGLYMLTVTDTVNGCQGIDSVMVAQDGNAPQLSVEVPDTLTCTTSTIVIDGSASASGPDIQLSWTTQNGVFVGGQNSLTPEVGAPGIYTLTLLDLTNNCTATTSVTVFQDTLSPQIVISVPDPLNCIDQIDTLDATASDQGLAFTFLWTTANGSIASGANTLTPVVDAPGVYRLEIFNERNGCNGIDSVTVESDVESPLVDAGFDQVITCDEPAVLLDGSSSAQDTSLVYLWTTLTGNFTSGTDSLTTIVDSPGVYFLSITDTLNGCTATDSVLVSIFADFPQVAILEPDTLDCLTTQLTLGGQGSAGPEFSYSWETQNGNILQGDTTLFLLIDAPGLYQLTVENTINGCSASETVTILQDTLSPVADAGQPFIWTCDLSDAMLDGSLSSVGSGFVYHWGTANGNILTGDTTLNPVINAPGTYFVTVSDLGNGCIATDTVIIQQDAAAPLATAGEADTLSCLITSLTLDGSGSSSGNNFTYLWTTTDGHIISGETGLTPLVDEAGTYFLMVTDTVNGCQTLSSVQIASLLDVPAVQLPGPPLLTCLETEIVLESVITNGTGTFSWTTVDGNILSGQNTPSPLINAPGTYSAVVTLNQSGCTDTVEVMVSQDADPPVAIALAPDPLGCGQGAVSLDGTGSSTGPSFSYLWTSPDGQFVSGENTLFPVVNAPGLYILVVTNAQNGCQAQAQIELLPGGNEPVVVILPPDEINCSQSEVTLNAGSSTAGPGIQVEWTTSDGQFVSGQNTLMPVVDAAGTYLLILTDTQTGCTGTGSVSVSEDKVPPAVDAGNDEVLDCNQDRVELHANAGSIAGFDFFWTFIPEPGITGDPFLSGQMSPAPWVNLPGTYTVTVTSDANGCTASDDLVVTSAILDAFDVEITEPGCDRLFGSLEFTGVIGGESPFEYSIDGGASYSIESLYENLPPGTYELSVLDNRGCELSQTVVLAAAAPFFLQLEPSVSLFPGESYQFNPVLGIAPGDVASYVWSPAEGLDCHDCLRPVLTAFGELTYTLLVTDKNGCTASASIDVFLKSPGLDLYVPNVFSPNGDGINDGLVIFARTGTVASIRSLQIFTRWGESVFEQYDFQPNDFAFAWDGTHRGQPLDSGVYVWFAEVELVSGDTTILEGGVTLVR